MRIADEAQFKFDRAVRALSPEGAGRLPVYGVGHSLGAQIHLLICARYAVARAGNVLLSYNNRPATDVIPFLSPFIAPGARLVGPLLSTLAASPLRGGAEQALDAIKGLSPSLVRQLTPLLEQLAPVVLDVSQGRTEFSPAPEEARSLVRTYYSVPRALLIRFRDDSLDETPALAALLQGSTPVASTLDVSVRTMGGDHVRPLHQAFVDLPPEVARLANQAVVAGGSLIGRLSDVAGQMGVQQATGPLSQLGAGVTELASLLGGERGGGPITDSMQALADEAAAFMGVGDVVLKGTKALPPRYVEARNGEGVRF